MIIRLIAAAVLLGCAPAFAQTDPVAPVAAPAPAELVHVAITTSMGVITLALDKTHAPITTANFVKYVTTKRYDGQPFYRGMKVGDIGLIQAGVQDGAKLMKPITLEPTSKTGILHTIGTVSMARAAPDSAMSDFFILTGNMPSLDANPTAPGDNLGFAAFGHVVSGMDVVQAILDAPKSATKGEGVMRGQMLDPQVKILSARVVAHP